MTNQRLTYNLEGQQELLTSVRNKTVKCPKGATLNNEAEKLLYSQLTRARSADDWRTMDLLLIVKIVHLETEITEQQERLSHEDYVCEGPKGGLFPNPRTGIIQQLQARQLSMYRVLGLQVVNSHAQSSAKAERQNEAKKVGDEGAGDLMELLD